MKGSALLDTMAREVDAECERTLAAARAEADAIVAAAREKSAAQRDASLKATEAEMVMLDERWRLKAEAEALTAGLSVRNDAVNEVLDQARGEIRSLVDGPDFPGVLDMLLSEVMAVAPAGTTVLAPEKHLDHVRGWLTKNGSSDVPVEASASMWDGVAVQDSGRTFRISNTLSGRFSRVVDNARRLCMTSLFSEGGKS